MTAPVALFSGLLITTVLSVSYGGPGSQEYYGTRYGEIQYPTVAVVNYRNLWDFLSGTNSGTEYGTYATGSRMHDVSGKVVHVRAWDFSNDGCKPVVNAPPPGDHWIALMVYGTCSIQQQIDDTVKLNASAVVVYSNDVVWNQLPPIYYNIYTRVPVVFMRHDSGERIGFLSDSGTYLQMVITRGNDQLAGDYYETEAKRASTLILVVPFIVLTLMALACLVFYYVQRVRYTNIKDRPATTEKLLSPSSLEHLNDIQF